MRTPLPASYPTPLDYYSTPGPMTDPGPYAGLFDGLPEDISVLCQVLQGVMVHIFWAERYGLKLSDERKAEVNLRAVAAQLARLLMLDDRPLTVRRPLERRLVGNCRDFSTLLCAILRHQGRPARARCGFGAYFLPNHYEDHWVCEYWRAEEERWVLVDAQLDDFQIRTLGVRFDPLEVPRDQFIVGGQAWQMCRSGQANPDHFGIFDMRGLWFVRGNLVRDVLALNKIEILPWDGGFGLLAKREEEATEEDVALDLMDRIAALTLAGDQAFGELRALYESEDRLWVPSEWQAYTAHLASSAS